MLDAQWWLAAFLPGVMLGGCGKSAEEPFAHLRVIYGPNSLKEPADFPTHAPERLWSLSTAIMIPRSAVIKGQDGRLTFAFADTLAQANRRAGRPLCDDEPFRDQPIIGGLGLCSAFLVGDDLLLTAGHCLRGRGDICREVSFDFHAAIDLDDHDPLQIRADDLYDCQTIESLEYHTDGSDFALVRVDRKVTGRPPLKLRNKGQIAPGERLVLIGHPMGLPTKIDGDARVLPGGTESYFFASADSYSGSSGSPVIGWNSRQVEGVLIGGETDFILREGCYVSKKCPEDGNADHGASCRGESVVRAPHILQRWNAPFGESPNSGHRSGP